MLHDRPHYYEEVWVDHRAKDPAFKAPKRGIRFQLYSARIFVKLAKAALDGIDSSKPENQVT